MESKLRSWWKKIKQHPVSSVIIMLAVAFGIVLLVAFIGGYFFNWDWTGFSSYIPPVKDSNYQRGKTLWDWLNLLGVLAIPAVVGLGAAWYTAQQGKVSDRENTDNQREAALQAYIDKISELILHENLLDSVKAQKIAEVRTTTTLRRLDAERKGSVVQFLKDAGLINRNIEDNQLGDHGIVSLYGADLRGANLSGAFLLVADLSFADLREANLSQANLLGATLSKANLSGADLSEASMVGVDLHDANLSGANLHGADLMGADLKGTNVTSEQLEQAASLKGATMPDGSIYA